MVPHSDDRAAPGTVQIVTIHHRLHRLYAGLAAAPTLAPGPAVDALFGELVGLVRYRRGERPDRVLGDPAVRAIQPHLHRLCADGEYALERDWAGRIAAAPDPWAELARFPYHGNYRQLTRLEYHTLRGLGAGPDVRVAFLGSGPLPLTSIVLAHEFGLRVDNVDMDAQAHALGSHVAGVLGLDGLRFHHGDVLDFDALGDHDVVVLAALVGLDAAGKRRLLRHLRAAMAPGALLLVRSAHRLRSLLYPAVDVDDLVGFTPEVVIQPFNEVINSVIVARRSPGARSR